MHPPITLYAYENILLSVCVCHTYLLHFLRGSCRTNGKQAISSSQNVMLNIMYMNYRNHTIKWKKLFVNALAIRFCKNKNYYSVSKIFLRPRHHQTSDVIVTSPLEIHYILIWTEDREQNHHTGNLRDFLPVRLPIQCTTYSQRCFRQTILTIPTAGNVKKDRYLNKIKR